MKYCSTYTLLTTSGPTYFAFLPHTLLFLQLSSLTVVFTTVLCYFCILLTGRDAGILQTVSKSLLHRLIEWLLERYCSMWGPWPLHSSKVLNRDCFLFLLGTQMWSWKAWHPSFFDYMLMVRDTVISLFKPFQTYNFIIESRPHVRTRLFFYHFSNLQDSWAQVVEKYNTL